MLLYYTYVMLLYFIVIFVLLLYYVVSYVMLLYCIVILHFSKQHVTAGCFLFRYFLYGIVNELHVSNGWDNEVLYNLCYKM